MQPIELISVSAGSITEMKALRQRCEEAGIEATLGCPGGGRSCGPKTHLLVAASEVPKVNELLRGEWEAQLAKENLGSVAPKASAEHPDEPPCPACGTAAPLVGGACSDCGLMLG